MPDFDPADYLRTMMPHTQATRPAPSSPRLRYYTTTATARPRTMTFNTRPADANTRNIRATEVMRTWRCIFETSQRYGEEIRVAAPDIAAVYERFKVCPERVLNHVIEITTPEELAAEQARVRKLLALEREHIDALKVRTPEEEVAFQSARKAKAEADAAEREIKARAEAIAQEAKAVADAAAREAKARIDLLAAESKARTDAETAEARAKADAIKQETAARERVARLHADVVAAEANAKLRAIQIEADAKAAVIAQAKDTDRQAERESKERTATYRAKQRMYKVFTVAGPIILTALGALIGM